MRTFAPSAGIYTGVSAPLAELPLYLKTTGSARVALYNQYTTPDGDFGWILREFSQAGATGMISWDFPGAGTQASIADGGYDAYIEQIVSEVHAYRHRLFIRLNWEFNGTWYPWSATGADGQPVLGNSPAEYVAAWRHVVELFRRDRNVTFVWSPTLYDITPHSGHALRAWYPGNAYVGWIGIDAYPGSASWSWMVHGTDALDEDYSFAAALKRPVMISEWALSSPGTGDNGGLVTRLVGWMLAHPLVKAELWFDYDNTAAGGRDYSITRFPRAASVLRRLTQSSVFLDTVG